MNIKYHIVCAVAAVLLVYYAFVAYMLHYSLDRLVFLHTKAEQTTEIDRYHVTDLNGNEIIVRHYGKGEVLEGTAPALSDAVYSYMKSKWYLHPAVLLPVQKIIKKDYLLTEAIGKLTSTKITIFQGTNDSLMPLDHIEEIVKGRSSVNFIAVNSATHSDAYIKALPLYVETILNMLNQQTPDKSASLDRRDAPGSQ